MRRAAIQAFRTARRAPIWRVAGKKPPAISFTSSQSVNLRPYSSAKYPAILSSSLQSSMHLRTFSVAVISTVVASGAWYAYQGDSSQTPAAAEMLTPEQATQKLRKNEESYSVNRGKGVVRYDVVQVPSNSPIEDDHAEKIVEVPASTAAANEGQSSSDWMFWAVFDGHSGWTTSAKLRNVLISYVARELNSTYKSAASDPSLVLPSSAAVDAAIKQGFVRLDNDIVHSSVDQVFKSNSRRAAAELLAPALSGSCALLAFYDSQSKDLKVACAGDSRAVLGRRSENGKWSATPLSEDQTGGTPSEMKRLREEHPGEPNVVRNGRILGQLEPSRSFGDAFYKWSKQTQDKIKRQFFGRTPHPLLKTPPYVTAEPVITTTKVEPTQGDFVVLATDGLWEMLSNEEVVGLVGQWIEEQQAGSGNKSWVRSLFSSQPQLPVETPQETTTDGQRRPIRQQQYDISGAANRFVVEDKNAATHLVRNAMGGKDKDMLCALLTLPSPYSRRYRDDVTVEVIFFGDSPDSRTVSVNEEASASEENVKAKL
ncbi:type 2C protein phosphatase ptcF [Aspergillus puulaauensis]|uniref:PPM-type phosphatase domain-containing protein n=1 Tax=Aspergillus puulaauensis TaxID=1220207 RepID=A0A7R7XQ07_9EURO|nr:uncharacterized protein APUU_41103S [Aspergillus puulaauensis]BCS24659.1 hypothetical protein APUU_41103S [Aspergillus puulaauensis]